MKYVSAVKYLNQAIRGKSSPERMRAICTGLGKINTGSRFAVVYANEIGVAAAELLASVLTVSGSRTALLRCDTAYDMRECVTVDGQMPTHEDFSAMVLEVSRAAKRVNAEMPWLGDFTRYELITATGLLAARCSDCEFVIMLAASDDAASVCEPTDVCVMPVVTDDPWAVRRMCGLIKGKIRETVVNVPGNVEYNIVADACSAVGCRLTQTAAATYRTEESSPSEVTFSYRGKDGYVVKNASPAVRTAAMLTVEAAIALKRMGVKLTAPMLAQGMSKVRFQLINEKISAMPNIILDRASDLPEIKAVAANFASASGLTVCVKDSAPEGVAALFPEKAVFRKIGERGDFPDEETAAKAFLEGARSTDTMLCLGTAEFVGQMKVCIRKIIDKM